MEKEKKAKAKDWLKSWGVAIIIAVIIFAITVAALFVNAHKQGKLQVAKAEIVPQEWYFAQDTFNWEYNNNVTDSTNPTGGFEVRNDGTWSILVLNIDFYDNEYLDIMLFNGLYGTDGRTVILHYTFNNYVFTFNFAECYHANLLYSNPNYDDIGIMITSGLSSLGNDAYSILERAFGATYDPTEDVPDIETSSYVWYSLDTYKTTSQGTFLLSYEILNADDHIDITTGQVPLYIYYTNANNELQVKLTMAVKVDDGTSTHYYFTPMTFSDNVYEGGGVYTLKFAVNENTQQGYVYTTMDTAALTNAVSQAAIQNKIKLDTYLDAESNTYIKRDMDNAIENAIGTELGIYGGMDMVTGIFAKIGELLNINIFGHIPLYVFILIPLIMGVVYVILKFVR